MSTFKEYLAPDIADTFFNVDEFADACTYTQGGLAVEVPAGIRKDAEYDAMDEEGFVTKVVMTEWHIPTASLPDLEPRPGDLIEVAVGTQTRKYEVAPPGPATPAVQLDVLDLVWRISSKRVS